MKIGIDAKWFFEGPVSNQIVVRSLVEHLILENPGNELTLFLNAKHKLRPFPFQNPNVKLVYVWAGNNMIFNAFFLPFFGRKLKLEGILYQNFGSFFGPKRWIYIHDVIFLSHPQFFTWAERMYFGLMPFLARWATRIITISHSEERRLRQFSIGKNCPVDIIYHAVDHVFKPKSSFTTSDLEAVKMEYKLPDSFILYVGRLNLRKNLGKMLQAFKLLRDQSVSLVIIGEKEWKSDPLLESQKPEAMDSQIMFLGKVPFKNLPTIYSLATVFCFPSIAEGFGLPVLEAMSAGIPVLTSENTAMQEVCGNAGVYFNPEDEVDISSKLSDVLGDDLLQSEMSVKGLERAKLFSWNKTAKQLYEVLSNS